MTKVLSSLLSGVLVLIGLYLFAFGQVWAPAALDFLPDTEIGFWIELIVPFLPMAFIASGAALSVSLRR